MKKIAFFLTISVFLMFGCIYEIPLVEEHTIPIDQSVLGLWEAIPEKGEKSENPEKMMVLKFSETEYIVHYPIDKDGMYFRAYPIKIGDISCVQIQLIGTGEGSVEKDTKEIYHVISYQLSNNILEIKMLNPDLVDKNLKDIKSLKEAFLKNKDNENLFKDPGKFKKIKK